MALRLFLFFLASFFWQESIFRIFIYQSFFDSALIFSTFFSVATAALFALFSTFGSARTNRLVAVILSFIISMLFCTQYVYYGFFKVPLSLYSMGQADQVAQFAGDIISYIFSNLIQLILLLLPTVLLFFVGPRLELFEKTIVKEKLLLGAAALGSFLFTTLILAILGSNNLAHSVYFNINDADTAQRTLGVVTNMRLDLTRSVFGFEEYIPEEDWGDDEPPSPSDTASGGNTSDNTSSLPETTYEPNIMSIDFDQLISDTKSDTVKKMHEYFKDVEPTLKNEYTGMFKDCNLIFMTCEAFSRLAVSEKYTPTLYKLVNEGLTFNNFYNPVWSVSTSDGEYVACTGLIPKSGVWSFHLSGSNSMPFCLGNQFGKLPGYEKPRAWHNHTWTYYKRNISHPNMGYDYKGVGHGLDVKKSWPESDLEMMEKTLPEYINAEKFHSYYMTVSGHMLYSFSGNAMASKNKEAVADLGLSEQAQAYIACNIELDKAMKYLIDQLEAAGKLDNTVIVFGGDHYPYGLDKSAIDELAGHTVEPNFELYKSSLVIWKNGMPKTEIDKPISSLDILPTISNLFGLEYDSRLMMGRDIFSTTPGLVMFKDRSWLTDKATYNAKTKETQSLNGEPVDEDYVKSINREVSNRFKYSTQILENDYYAKVFK